MKEEWLLIAGLFALFLFGVIWFIVTNESRVKKRLLERIRSEWGNPPERTYESEELQSIREAYMNREKKHPSDSVIDNITWNDLDMDRVFAAINATQSSSGDEAVYHALRTPCTDTVVLERRDRAAEFFRSNGEVREKMQLHLSRIGRPKRYSVTSYLDLFMEFHTDPVIVHIIPLIFLVICIVIIPFNVITGILCLLGVLFYNVFNYYRIKGKVEPYFVCVNYIVNMVRFSEKICKEFKDYPELKDYIDRLEAAAGSLRPILKESWFVSANAGGISDNPAQLVYEYVNMVTHLDLIAFGSILKKIQFRTDDVSAMNETLGDLELCIAIASLRERIPLWVRPEFDTEPGKKAFFEGIDLYHPLLKEPVANSITEDRCVLLTGSNASGKSTFLKTTAINAILAQTVYTVLGSRYCAPMFQIYSSMALSDDLENEDSYYMVEIKSLKRIVEASKNTDRKILCFVDEILRGTNTVERIAASSQILKMFSSMDNCLCFAATHDIELTYILENEFANYHFREDMTDATDDKPAEITFSYCIHNGRSETRNAIRLLDFVGYDKDITGQAEQMAVRFEKTGKWSMD